MARMTKKIISHIWDATNRCYKEALCEEYPDVFKRFNIDNASDQDMREILFSLQLPARSESINNKYLDRLVKLPTKELELIVEAHKKEKILRAQPTIEAILDELMLRST